MKYFETVDVFSVFHLVTVTMRNQPWNWFLIGGT